MDLPDKQERGPDGRCSTSDSDANDSQNQIDADLSARQARRTLFEIMREDGSFEQKAYQALELGRKYLDADNAHLTRIDTETNHWKATISTDPSDGQFPPGLELDLETTYCRRTIENDSPITLHDAPNQGWEDDPAFETHGLHCYHGTTILLDDDPYGTICFVAEDPREEAFGDDETMFAELITRELERALERERHEAELTRRNNLVNVLNRVLRHNLRNDMTVIRGHTQMMVDSLRSDSHAEVTLRKIDDIIDLCQKARELENIVGQDLDRHTTDIRELVERVVGTIERQFPSASFTVDGDSDVEAAVLPSFERALKEVIENAAKHSGTAPSVTVSVESVPNAVSVTVTDDGPGIPTEELSVLETGEETPLVHGSGLGLWLVYWIVTSHDGTIETSVGDDGTTMTLSVPRSPETETERVREFREARDLYQAAFDNAFDAMVIIDDDTRIVDANPEAATIYDVDREDLLGRSIREFLPDEFDFETAWTTFQKAGEERDTVTIQRADGTERTVEYSATTDIIPDRHLVISRDVTERKERERTLRETTQRLEALVEASPDPILAIGSDGIVRLWNDAAEDLFGYTAEEAIGTSIQALDIHGGDQRSEFADRLGRAFAGETFTGLEVQRRTKEGKSVYLSISTAPLRDETGDITGVMAICKDLTHSREDSVEALQITDQVIKSSPTGIAIADLDGTITSVNPAFLEMWGYATEESVVGRSVTEFWEDPDAAAQVAATVERDGHWSGELRAVRPDGSTFLAQCIAGIVTDNDGSPIALMSSFLDITERKEYELRLKEQRDNLDTLNQIIRHDIRNDLQIVTARVDMLAEHMTEESEQLEFLRTMRESATHAVELTETAHTMAEVMLTEEITQRAMPLRSTLEDELERVREKFPGADVVVDGTLPPVMVTANELLDSVFRNLLTNAIKHNDTSVPEVTVSATATDETVQVRVADNGPGIDDSRKEEIFGKGEKALESHGEGLGLYLVRTLLESYNGEIWVEDNDPEGTVFVVELMLK